MKILPAAALAIGISSACSNPQTEQSRVVQDCPPQSEAAAPAPDPKKTAQEDLVYARSVLIQKDIEWLRRELTEKFGRDQATDIFFDCQNQECNKEVSSLSDPLYRKASKKEMDICFQGGDIDPDCMDGTFFRRFGDDYLIYMDTKNMCNQVVAECLQKHIYPDSANEPYDPHLRDPLDPWNR